MKYCVGFRKCTNNYHFTFTLSVFVLLIMDGIYKGSRNVVPLLRRVTEEYECIFIVVRVWCMMPPRHLQRTTQLYSWQQTAEPQYSNSLHHKGYASWWSNYSKNQHRLLVYTYNFCVFDILPVSCYSYYTCASYNFPACPTVVLVIGWIL
jgi:hypothetical protein